MSHNIITPKQPSPQILAALARLKANINNPIPNTLTLNNPNENTDSKIENTDSKTTIPAQTNIPANISIPIINNNPTINNSSNNTSSNVSIDTGNADTKSRLLAMLKARQQSDTTTNSAPNNANNANNAHTTNTLTTTISNTISNAVNTDHTTGIDKYGNTIHYNSQQQEFIKLVAAGKSAILIGAAGTGKTTTMRGAMEALIANSNNAQLSAEDHSKLTSNTPPVVIVSFTRRAVSNIRKSVSEDLAKNCLTIHALLEYEPQYLTIIDNETGEEKNTMRFEATRNAANPLPSSIRTIVIEEASMVSTELFTEITNALSHEVQFIFLGDIQQLPPVFGSAILGYKMLELPVIELTEVYRQALESPIIKLAHRILSGKPIPVDEYPEWKLPGLTIHPWKKKISADSALIVMASFLKQAMDAEHYNTEEDIILIPFNKSCGTIELNKHLAQHIARKGNKVVHEIIAGFSKCYFSVGDKVLCDKEDGIILDIQPNSTYAGKLPQEGTVTMDYWGHDSGSLNHDSHTIKDDDVDFLLSAAVSNSSSDETGRKASHVITIQLLDSERTITIDKAGDVSKLLLAYALTVHKSQGSEFRKVFLMLHQSHNTMLFRELLYTAVTRAREELYVICEADTFTKGILSQRIKGNSLAEKALYFQGKLDNSLN